MSNEAQCYLAKRQNEYRPLTGVDRAKQLYQMIAPDLLPSIQNLYDSGMLAIGEVGIPQPLALTRPLGYGEFVVEISSGLMQFLYAVSRTLCGVVRVTEPDSVVEPVLSHQQSVERMAEIFEFWKTGRLFQDSYPRYPSFRLHPQQIKIAEDLTTKAELLVLAHELGHVVMETDPDLAGIPPDLYGTKESFPDAFSVMTVLSTGPRF